MRFANALEHFVALRAAARNRAIRNCRHAVPAAGRYHLVLIEKRVALDLITDKRLARNLDRLIEQRHGEIRYAYLPRVALTLHLGHGTERLGQRHAWIRPVDQEQVDGIKTQPRKALLDGAFQVVRGEQGWLYLGRNHDLCTLAGRAHALAHFTLVVVHLCCIDMAVADADRLLH